MREFSSPLSITVPATGNLTDDVVTNGRDFADTVVFSRRTGDEWSDVTAAEFLDEVQAVAKGLVAAGVEVGDRVALLSKTRYEWTLLDYAIWFAGAVTVPIYETSSAEQIGWILQDSGTRAIVAEGPDHLARVRDEGSSRWRQVDYRNMGSEELGSIYESLLELVPKHSAVDTPWMKGRYFTGPPR